MSAGIADRDIDPGDKALLRREARQIGVSMEELVRRLRRLVQTDPALLSVMDRVASREAEPYSAAIEFLGSSDLAPESLSAGAR